MLIIGIDPGKSNGGIAIYNSVDKRWRLARQPDEGHWVSIFREWPEDALAGVEKLVIRPDDRDKPSFFGLQRLVNQTERMFATLRTVGVKTVEVYPQAWQSPHKLKRKESQQARKKRYQKIAGQLVGRKVSLWASDAVLIAYYLAMKLHDDPEWVNERLTSDDLLLNFTPNKQR